MVERPPRDMISPCVQICVVDFETDLCIGCGRSRNEIAQWTAFSAEARAHVLALLPGRLETLTRRRKRKGGARARRAKT